jgi:hypothetical protein
MPENFLSAKWENLIMANYAVDPQLLIPYLPAGVELDYHDGKTYVSLVGFLFKNTKLFSVPIPLLGTFEEVNLRFYVKRTEGSSVKRGVVFINETVPYKAVAWMANKLYKEHYTAVPTKSQFKIDSKLKHIAYQWRAAGIWNTISVVAKNEVLPMKPGSIEEFIFENYYGFTKVSNFKTEEYQINHPSWLINEVQEYEIDCDFKTMYGTHFEHLSSTKPDSIMIAEGSAVSVKWKRKELVFN